MSSDDLKANRQRGSARRAGRCSERASLPVQGRAAASGSSLCCSSSSEITSRSSRGRAQHAGGGQNAETGPGREGRKKDARGASVRGVLLLAGCRGVQGAGGRGEPVPNASASGKDSPGTRGSRKGRKQHRGGFNRSGEEVTHGGKLRARPGASSRRRCRGRCGHMKVPPGNVPYPVGDKPRPPHLPDSLSKTRSDPPFLPISFPRFSEVSGPSVPRGGQVCSRLVLEGSQLPVPGPAVPPPR